jgi:hypothetical protein
MRRHGDFNAVSLAFCSHLYSHGVILYDFCEFGNSSILTSSRLMTGGLGLRFVSRLGQPPIFPAVVAQMPENFQQKFASILCVELLEKPGQVSAHRRQPDAKFRGDPLIRGTEEKQFADFFLPTR